jgi:hypothetical protein
MALRKSLPDINRLSIVAAAIMLAFGLTRLVSFPARLLSFTVMGILLEFNLDFSTIITLLTAALAAAGMDWLIQGHASKPEVRNHLYFVRHWITPVLTTLVIGVALNNFAGGPFWWVIYGLGSVLLMAVLVAEYNVVDVEDVRHPLATVGLTGLSFALFLLLAISVFAVNLRLYLRLPLLGLGALMVISRALYLRLGEWLLEWSLVISAIVAEIAVGFHYLPVSPTQFGLVLVGCAYALTSFTTGIKELRQGWALWAEPVGMLLVVLLVGFLWG